MKYLLDTAVFLWMIFGDEAALSKKVMGLLAQGENQFFLSAVSSWEIAIKYALGKLEFKIPPKKLLPDMILKMGLQPLPILSHHALEVSELPDHHRDPFDRLLIAQAKIEGLPIVSPDKVFKKYGVTTIW